MVRRSMKSDVTYVNSGPERHAEGLNRAIEVLVVNGVLVMTHAGRWVRYSVNDERATIDTGLRLDQHASCAGPGVGRWLHSECLADRRKREIGSAGYRKLAI